MTKLVMPHITRLNQIRRRYNFIIILINGYYIHFKEVIIMMPFLYKFITFKYKFITLKHYFKTIFAQQ
jgi:hypothetical protein